MRMSVWMGLCLVVAFAGVAAADDPVDVYVHGELLELDPAAMERDGQVYLPVRAVSEAVGSEVTYFAHREAVVVCSGERCTDMPREESIKVDMRLLVPMEALDEALDVDIDWHPEQRVVALRTGAVGMMAPAIVLPGVNGPYERTSWDDKAAVAVVWWANHCPTVIRYEDRFIELVADYTPRGVEFVAVGSNCGEQYPADNFEKMQERAEEKGYNFFYVRDETQEVARAYGPERTPDVFLVNPAGFVVYRGSIEDSEHVDQVQRRHLREALDELLAGEPISMANTPPHGCTVKWKR
ncbi:MAG: redoxin family protein [Armatimonadota bacterium]|jgi:peroxiredoxin